MNEETATKTPTMPATGRAEVKATLVNERKVYFKDAQAFFADKALATVRTTDVSLSDIYVISPVHVKKKSPCWLTLTFPQTPEINQVFKLQTLVTSSVYSHASNGFRISLAFISPEAAMLKLIHQLK